MSINIHDPRDPWAWRNTWTGEIRDDYSILWVVVPVTVGLVLIALLFLVPVLIHRYCRPMCYCEKWCGFFDRFLLVCHAMDKRKNKRRRGPRHSRTHFSTVYQPTVIPRCDGTYVVSSQRPWPTTTAVSFANPNCPPPRPHHPPIPRIQLNKV